MNNISWNLIRSFLMVVNKGSLSAAAKALDVSQPTVSRDIHSLEKYVQQNLFKRNTQGLILTRAGKALTESALKMSEHAESFNRKIHGLSTEIAGNIRISANEVVGICLLPSAVAAFVSLNPAVNVEILITNKTTNLNKCEADLALRMYRPTQPSLIVRRLPDMPLGFYAHQNYIKKHGIPESLKELRQHRIIGFDQATSFIDYSAAAGYQFSRNDFSYLTDSVLMQLNLARSASGIVATHKRLAEQWSELKPVLEWVNLPLMEFWVVCHGDVRGNVKTKAFADFLINWFEQDAYHGLKY